MKNERKKEVEDEKSGEYGPLCLAGAGSYIDVKDTESDSGSKQKETGEK